MKQESFGIFLNGKERRVWNWSIQFGQKKDFIYNGEDTVEFETIGGTKFSAFIKRYDTEDKGKIAKIYTIDGDVIEWNQDKFLAHSKTS